ncbi:MAG: DMT family transporter [Rhodospirillales bacterium]|nr:DMT family transporter [Rhodospirillales bacterium]MDE2574659.1 DMT family transporter [Rhodospirillales bacterium]
MPPARTTPPVRRDRVDALAIGVVVLLCALWGIQQVAVKVAAAGGLPPLFQASFRSAAAALLVLAWIGARQGGAGVRAAFRRDAALAPGLVIALLFGLEFLCLFPGLRLTTASRGVLFLYTAPFFTAAGAHVFLPHERLRPRQVLGLVVAFGGVAAAFAEGLGAPGGSVAGDLLCLAAGALWGATTVVVKASPSLSRSDSARILFLQLAGSVPVLLIAAVLGGQAGHWPQASELAWLALLYQTVVVAFASYLAWFWLILIYPATRLSGFTFLTPLFGILAGHLLLGEPASVALLVGLGAIAVGMRLLNARAIRAAVARGDAA